MVKIYHVETDTKVISMWQPYTAMSIPQVHASTGYYINKNFILYTIHEHSIFPRSFIFVFNSTID